MYVVLKKDGTRWPRAGKPPATKPPGVVKVVGSISLLANSDVTGKLTSMAFPPDYFTYLNKDDSWKDE